MGFGVGEIVFWWGWGMLDALHEKRKSRRVSRDCDFFGAGGEVGFPFSRSSCDVEVDAEFKMLRGKTVVSACMSFRERHGGFSSVVSL